MPLIFLLTGASSFADPGDWNPVNKIECLGSGSTGALAKVDSPEGSGLSGGGGGGGGYGFATNQSPSFPVTVNIAAKNTVTSSTWWNSSSTIWGGSGEVIQSGNYNGANGGNFGPQGYSGGHGGNPWDYGEMGAGGGGAAGPHGIGSVGANTNPSTPGVGGAGDGGTTPASGQNGTQWDASHGCGSGGIGSTFSVAAGAGGNYGAGGGSQAMSSGMAVGQGKDGLLVITYTSLPPAPKLNYAIIMS